MFAVRASESLPFEFYQSASVMGYRSYDIVLYRFLKLRCCAGWPTRSGKLALGYRAAGCSVETLLQQLDVQ